MFSPDQYELLDFGDGRKLERFAGVTLDRPAPAGGREKVARPQLWPKANLCFVRTDRQSGTWRVSHKCPTPWLIRHDAIVLELKCADSGAVGIFPEQAPNWNWLARQIQRMARPATVLNLFAYTGGSTLTAAAAGAEVTHVDAASGVVSWARRCARHAHLEAAPIRWIVDDAVRFAEREVRRGNTYAGIVLDPPSYGHGPKGEDWKIDRDLPRLLQLCRKLLSPHPAFFLLSCHAPNIGPAELEALAAEHVFGGCQTGVQARRLWLHTQAGRRLSSGVAARWPGSGS